MNRTNTPQIKSVTTTKEGRFWALKADGKLLAIVLYKTGAFELKRLIQGLAGLPVDEPEDAKPEAKTEAKNAKAKVPAPLKGKAGAKPKPPQKSASSEKATPTAAPATATA
jgi:hypothetical protein